MIRAEELRIGNLVISVTHGILNAKIEAVGRNALVFLKGVSAYDFLDRLEPILLTPEILEKAGFKCLDAVENNTTFDQWAINGVELIWEHDEGFCNVFNDRDIKFLHELQNLTFALTGEELEIDLS